ncbi:MAG TPA: ABC transporter permease subunit [Candidatus Acidoferrales bacterium]|jgi:NitT/TauT family transport system permease protein|nr:ABC transporter permease subunit [Candidatus Acidoferrales bacterium]
MKMEPLLNDPSILRRISERTRWKSTLVADVSVFVALLAILYALFASGRIWFAPFTPVANIASSPRALPLYAAYSLVRIAIAYVLSLLFALGYGLAAAKSERAAKIMLPLLDILQSIPVLSFLPGVMLAMVALFPGRQLGLELGSILLIFTGQAWNIAFSFYASLKSIPRELDEAARLYRFSNWQRFTELELPFAAIGLVWNSMMSVAGGWFFLMACEMFVLGARDFRLPGLGSYLQVAAGAGDTRAILWGMAAMIVVIVLLDQLIWRPAIAWSDKFKFETVEGAAPQSFVLTVLRRSGVLASFYRSAIYPVEERVTRAFAAKKTAGSAETPPAANGAKRGFARAFGAALLAAMVWLAFRALASIAQLGESQLFLLMRDAAFTFLRVNAALVLGALWAVPAGVWIGTTPRVAKIAQPVVQIAASVPATALFPVLLLLLIRAGGGMGLAAMALMLLGTQWYILFNVIAGAMAIPTDLKEASSVFRFTRWERWRRLILPAIFPYLVTGMLTASGGAWNASIVAEYFHFQGKTLSVRGLGAAISRATDSGDLPVLLAATMVMSVIVVTVNRTLWQKLYRLAATRFKLET